MGKAMPWTSQHAAFVALQYVCLSAQKDDNLVTEYCVCCEIMSVITSLF